MTGAASLVAAALEADLRQRLRPESIAVRDDSAQHAGHAGARDGGHYALRIVAACFAGRGRVARHRLVYDALGSLPARGIHALVIEALAPGER
jgi:BolA protein